MNKTRIGAVAAGLILFGAGFGAWAQSGDSAETPLDNVVPADMSSRRNVLVSGLTKADVDGMRTVSFNVSGTEGFFFFDLPAGSSIDVGTMIISNGFWSEGNYARFGLNVAAGSARLASATSNSFGTTTVTFPKPLKLRELDHEFQGYFGPPSLGGATGVVEVTLIGTPPVGVIDSISVQ